MKADASDLRLDNRRPTRPFAAVVDEDAELVVEVTRVVEILLVVVVEVDPE